MLLLPVVSDDLGDVRMALISDVPFIVDLCAKEHHAIGFIPKPAYESAITGIKKGHRWSETCNDKMWVCDCSGDLVGFVLASFGRTTTGMKRGRIAQICLQADARMLQRGRLLLESVIDYGKIVGTFRWSCGCADDLESNIFWMAMGWSHVGERRGIHFETKRRSDRKVNLYLYDPMDFTLRIVS